MWLVGYLLFILALAMALHRVYQVESTVRRRAVLAGVACLFLPVSWSGQIVLIPTRGGGAIKDGTLGPHLVIACFSTCLGLLIAHLLWRSPASKPPALWKFIGMFAAFHAGILLLTAILVVGLWPAS